MDKAQIAAIVNAIGSIAEISAIYYNTLRQKGVTEDAATKMSQSFIQTFVMITMANGSENAE